MARLLLRIRRPPHGGARHDYVGWALDKESHGLAVTRAWDYGLELGLGTVTVRFMMDDAYADGIPLAADVTTVQTYIDQVPSLLTSRWWPCRGSSDFEFRSTPRPRTSRTP